MVSISKKANIDNPVKSKKSYISFAKGAIILVLSGLLSRTFGFGFRVYLSNLIGSEGMGIYQLVYPLYSLVVLTLTSGISISVSRLVASGSAGNNPDGVYPGVYPGIVRSSLFIMVLTGSLCAVPVFFGSGFISENILGDARTGFSLMLMAPFFPVVVCCAVFKGWFYGMGKMLPVAVSSIFEQGVKIAFILSFTSFFRSKGQDVFCSLAIIATAIGEVANMLILFGVFSYDKIKQNVSLDKMKHDYIKQNLSFSKIMHKKERPSFSLKYMAFKILKDALPVSANRLVLSLLSSAELILIPAKLQDGGLNQAESLSVFGKLAGMALPLLFFPSLIPSSLATTLIPAVSEAKSRNNKKLLAYRVSQSIKLTFITGFVFTVIFISFPGQIGKMIYKNENLDQMLFLLGFSCVFLYLQQTLTGILNGLGLQGKSLRNSLTGYLIRILFVIFLIPVYGICGYIWGLTVSTAVNCIMNITLVLKETDVAPDFVNWFFWPLITSAILFLASPYLFTVLYTVLPSSGASTIITIAVLLLSGYLILRAFGAVEKGEFTLFTLFRPMKNQK